MLSLQTSYLLMALGIIVMTVGAIWGYTKNKKKQESLRENPTRIEEKPQ